ncbi:echinoderm microtubule-associated protein-like 4 [Crassostrea virginica]
MDGYDSIEAYIRDDKFSKLSPDAKTYKVQVKSQTPHASDEKETEKKHVTEKTKGNVCDVVTTPEMTLKQTKSRRQRKKGRLPSEDSTSSESSVMGIPSRRDAMTSRRRNKNQRGSRATDPAESKAAVKKKTRRSPKSTEIPSTSSPILNSPTQPTLEQVNPEEKFQRILSENLKEYSRQRMRALHMSLRHFSNVEARITQKELNQAFQDNQIRLSGRVSQYLIDRFEDNRGIDCERLYRFLTDAHMKSGRDSVMALQRRNDLETQPEMTLEEKDADLLQRLEDLLIENQGYFNVESLRESFQKTDKEKAGKLNSKEVLDLCNHHHTPLYGALLKSLLKRCDIDCNDLISWPEFLNFLDLSQQNAQKKCPALCDAPRRVKSSAPVTPSPIDELSEETKSRLVSKLRKKVSLVKDRNLIEKQDEDQENPREMNGDIRHKEVLDEKSVKEEDENPDRKRIIANMRRVTNLVKTSSGFLSTVKTFISGKRKSESDMKTLAIQTGDTDIDNNNLDYKMTSSSDDVSGSFNISVKDGGCESSPDPPPNKPKTSRSAPLLSACDEVVPDKDQEATGKIEADPKSVCSSKSVKEGSTSSRHKNDKMYSIKGKNSTVEFLPPCDVDKHPQILDPPTQRLKLDWVYGYRGNDCRSNVFVLVTDEIVYFLSNIAVLYNKQTHRQRHYREHTEDINCLAVHGNGNIVVTGQNTSKTNPQYQAHIRVWRADTLQTTQVLGAGMFQKTILSVAFAGSSDLFAAVDNSSEKRLTLWDVTSGELKGDTIVNTEVICDLQFNPKYPDVMVISGKEYLAWWKIYPDSRMIQPLAQPNYENFLRAKYVICLSHNDRGDLLTGDSNGTVYVWGDGGNKITNFIKHGHDGPVFAVLCMKTHILTGGRDGFIYSWQFNKNMEMDGELPLPKLEGGVRLLVHHGDSIIIGTTVNSMLSITPSKRHSPLKDVVLDQVPMTQGHFNEVRGLARIPQSESLGTVLTAGTDGVLCWFNPLGRDPVCKLVLKGIQFLSVDALPTGKHVALGTRDGHLVVLDIVGVSSTESFNQKLCKDKITIVKFSPDGTSIAAGSADGCVYVCALTNKENGSKNWEFTGKFKDHKEPIQFLDWSADPNDSAYLIKSCTAGPQQCVWNTSTFCSIEKFDTRTIKWQSETCAVDVSMCGLWSTRVARDCDILCVTVNPQHTLVAMGDSKGQISLFRYPCFKQGAFCHTYKSHSSVRNLLFSEDGQFLISVGGRDLTVLQWELT